MEALLRELTPQVLAALARRNGSFERCEDATQEALLAAARQWPDTGVPDDPRAWLITVANRRLIDQVRSEQARRRREETALQQIPDDERHAAPADAGAGPEEDDALTLLFLCCHPALTEASQLALTLRAVGGLTTAEIAAAFLVPEATMAQRISRAKASISQAGGRFELPPDAERGDRLAVVLHVLYLIFNEGYTASAGAALQRRELAREAIRLVRLLRAAAGSPPDGEVDGLLALMLLTHARTGAREDGDGSIVPLAEQDRARWDAALIAEGVGLLETSLRTTRVGPYQLQAAIAAVHAEAPSADATDWPQVLKLYDLLASVAPGPAVTLNRAVAVAMVDGAPAGLAALDTLDGDRRMADHHRLASIRAHLHELAGDLPAALADFRAAARGTTSIPERRYLEQQVTRLGCRDGRGGSDVPDAS